MGRRCARHRASGALIAPRRIVANRTNVDRNEPPPGASFRFPFGHHDGAGTVISSPFAPRSLSGHPIELTMLFVPPTRTASPPIQGASKSTTARSDLVDEPRRSERNHQPDEDVTPLNVRLVPGSTGRPSRQPNYGTKSVCAVAALSPHAPTDWVRPPRPCRGRRSSRTTARHDHHCRDQTTLRLDHVEAQPAQ